MRELDSFDYGLNNILILGNKPIKMMLPNPRMQEISSDWLGRIGTEGGAS
ncbi:hypothetical protein [Desulfopila aestuarii]|uniref:Uncharacterized protein n=1 Tax=Desulfopila aestuarii DSM 18488 TaxID=1121416 RepID=A0A1M7YK08_9BACT|nr:hypothetical protein [Desulfopila aestuarii]SHO52959.1 hypothetical protein SAMN02745220_04854 [Desulfopila aestuarii DSM 18488]